MPSPSGSVRGCPSWRVRVIDSFRVIEIHVELWLHSFSFQERVAALALKAAGLVRAIGVPCSIDSNPAMTEESIRLFATEVLPALAS